MQQTIENLNATTLRERLQAAHALLDSAALDALIAALDHHEVEVRWRAAAVLGWIGDARAVQPLVKRGIGEGYEVKYNIVWALGQIGSAQAIQPLLDIVHAGDSELPDIRYNAALALARLGQTDTLRESLVGSPEPVYRVAHAALATYEWMD